MEEVYVTPDGGNTLHKFNLQTTIDVVITKLGSELGIGITKSEHWTIALGMSKMVHWNNFNNVKNLSLRKYLELYPISEFQKIEGAIPLYLTDSSYHVEVDYGQDRESFALSGMETLRAIVDFSRRRLAEKPEYFILQNAIIISRPILDIPIKELCISKDIHIQAVFPITV
jgi:hypothetical protein